MGYFKNQLIERQVELGDRKPVPATDHAVFYVPVQSRRFVRQLETTHDRELRRIAWNGWFFGFGIGVVGGLIAGLAL